MRQVYVLSLCAMVYVSVWLYAVCSAVSRYLLSLVVRLVGMWYLMLCAPIRACSDWALSPYVVRRYCDFASLSPVFSVNAINLTYKRRNPTIYLRIRRTRTYGLIYAELLLHFMLLTLSRSFSGLAGSVAGLSLGEMRFSEPWPATPTLVHWPGPLRCMWHGCGRPSLPPRAYIQASRRASIPFPMREGGGDNLTEEYHPIR
jgi:hypothetical protein